MKHLGTKQIETDRLILRRFTVDDAEKMYENWAGDLEVTKYLTWMAHQNIEETRNILSGWVSSYQDDKTYQWCIAVRKTGEPIGSISAAEMHKKAQSMEIAYCIGRKYWHQGISSEALAAVMEFLLNEVGAQRIEARHDAKNPYSGAVMKKCGMRYEGTRRKAGWNNSGICDTVLYGYVKGEADCRKNGEIIEESAGDALPCTHSGSAPKNVISDETIAYVGILAKLELNDEEKEQAKKDMGEMLDYIDQLNELDTTNIEPMSHIFPVNNVFREDEVTNGDGSRETLSNAPSKKDGGFKVPKTIG